MIRVFAEPGLFAREFLETAFRAFRASLLQALAQSMMALAVAFNRLTTKRLTLAISSQVHDAQINAEGIGHFIRGVGTSNVTAR